jgi:hypothetical protein
MGVTGPGFNLRLEEIGRQLRAGWASIEQSRVLLARAVQTRRLPNETELAGEEERQRVDARLWRKTEAALAGEVLGLAQAIARHKLAFDRRDQPNRMERLLGQFSRSRMRRLTTRRWARLESFDALGTMMRHADALHGLLTAARERLQEERRHCESDLVELARHRGEMLRPLVDDPSAASRAEAVGLVEDGLRLYGALAKTLNRRVARCNTLLHKLAVETEEVLILYRVLADVSGQGSVAQTELRRLPHLREVEERFSSGRLIGADLDPLRERADAEFHAAFSEHAPSPAAAELPKKAPAAPSNPSA